MNPGSEDCLPCACFRKFSLEVRMESGQRRGQRRSVEGGSGERGWSHMNAEEWGKLSTSWGRRMLSERRDEAWKAADTADCRSEAGTGETSRGWISLLGVDINVLVSWWSA